MFGFLMILIESRGLQPSDIYNFDETGFQIGTGRAEKSLYKNPKTRKTIASQSSRTLVTSIECTSADGYLLPPLIIMPRKRHMKDWYEKNQAKIPPQYIVQPTENGYTNDEIGYHWIHHFHAFTKDRTTGTYRLIVMDNHGSHLTAQFIQFACDHDILLLPFPPHLTHLLQPLDSVPFQQYKRQHGLMVNRAFKFTKSQEKYDKVMFLSDIHAIRMKTFTKRTIKAGWKHVGIEPYNPRLILDKIRDYSHTPELQIFGDKDNNVLPANPTPTTPHTIRALRQQIKDIEASHPDLSPSIRRVLRGVLGQAESLGLAESLLSEIGKEREHRANTERSKSYLATPNILYVRDAVRELDKKKSDEIDKMWRSHKRDIKKLLKDIGEHLEQPPQSSSPIAPNPSVPYI
jgi:hypothetical protein